jgi:putative DNA methylase
MMVERRQNRKLIEVSLPLEVINRESQRETTVRQAKPASLHHWWARRPHVNARAVLFAQLVDDPSSHPDKFPTLDLQEIERSRLHAIIERLAKWENSDDRELLEDARHEVLASNGEMPSVVDPFAGGGTIPLEAQRLGLVANGSDLNPISVLINKALIEIPPLFAGRLPVFPGAEEERVTWSRNEGLGQDVKHYGQLLLEKAESQFGHLYPRVNIPGDGEYKVIAWIWARTVKSPNPANPIEVPLVRSWWLSTKKGKRSYVLPRVHGGKVTYAVMTEETEFDPDSGTIGRAGGVSFADGTPFSLDYIRAEGKAGRIGHRLIAIAAEGPKGRIYVSPDEAAENLALEASRPTDIPSGLIPDNTRDFRPPLYGMNSWTDLFTNRQLIALTGLTDLIPVIRRQVLEDALKAGWEEGASLESGGSAAIAYADSIATYLALAIDKLADLNNSLARWESKAECPRQLFGRHAVPMIWDYAEANPLGSSSGSFQTILDGMVRAFGGHLFNVSDVLAGKIEQADASTRDYSGLVICTDPPYYDNIDYANLSDFFYIWLRRSLMDVYPSILSTLLTPKLEELVANPVRHGGADGAEKFFVSGFNQVFTRIRESANTSVPMTVYYAYKQHESDNDGTSSTGWHTLLDGLIRSGWEITATWPMQTEGRGRMISHGANALASSIVLACRPRPSDADSITRRGFLAELKQELPNALRNLIQGEIAPVDLAQAAIGPGISVFSRYSRVRESDGSDMSVRDALLLINATLDEVLNEQESDFDPDTRFAMKWYRQFGWAEGPYGTADQLARSSDTSIGALERGGVFIGKAGRAKLLSPSLLDGPWDPETDDKISIWECVVRLAGIMSREGADSVAKLLPSVEKRVGLDPVKELGFLLFHEAEKKGDTKDAIMFNGLVGAWGDLREQARKHSEQPEPGFQMTFDFDEQGAS